MTAGPAAAAARRASPGSLPLVVPRREPLPVRLPRIVVARADNAAMMMMRTIAANRSSRPPAVIPVPAPVVVPAFRVLPPPTSLHRRALSQRRAEDFSVRRVRSKRKCRSADLRPRYLHAAMKRCFVLSHCVEPVLSHGGRSFLSHERQWRILGLVGEQKLKQNKRTNGVVPRAASAIALQSCLVVRTHEMT